MAQLGEVLVAMGATTPERLRAALENQNIFGNRLGTNLLAMGAITEEALAQALSRLHSLPSLHGDVEIEQAVVALLRAERVDRLEVVPVRVDGRRLEVLVADPTDLAKLDEVAFATGKLVRPIVVPELCLWRLLERYYGLSRQVRGMEVARSAPRDDASPAVASDLMAETEFHALYTGPERAAAALPPRGSPVVAGSAPAALAARPSAMAPPRPLPSAAPILARATPAASPPAAAPPADDDRPLAFADAVAALARAEDHSEVARAVLRFARSRFQRVVLLAVNGDLAMGWDGVGDGVTSSGLAQLRLDVREPGIVHSVVETRAHVLGPLLNTEQDLQLLRCLGRGAPRNAFAAPILSHERIATVLYADDGGGELVDAASVGELLILAPRIAYTCLMLDGRDP